MLEKSAPFPSQKTVGSTSTAMAATRPFLPGAHHSTCHALGYTPPTTAVGGAVAIRAGRTVMGRPNGKKPYFPGSLVGADAALASDIATSAREEAAATDPDALGVESVPQPLHHLTGHVTDELLPSISPDVVTELFEQKGRERLNSRPSQKRRRLHANHRLRPIQKFPKPPTRFRTREIRKGSGIIRLRLPVLPHEISGELPHATYMTCINRHVKCHHCSFSARRTWERRGALAPTAGGDSGCPSRGAGAGAASPSAWKLASRSPRARRVAGAQPSTAGGRRA